MQGMVGKPGFMDVALAVLLGIGCILSLPIYWWLFMTPIIRLLKRTRKPPLRRIP
ncbi:MAG: hypothetical protein HOP33_09235 [Verrucomicrobia bacterium]|nr:hypothetical protein [Verrucomicrobiota bacterium]